MKIFSLLHLLALLGYAHGVQVSTLTGNIISYEMNLFGLTKGNNVTGVFAVGIDASGNVGFAQDEAQTWAGVGTTSVSHTFDFTPLKTVIFGVTEGIIGGASGTDKDHIVLGANSAFASAKAGLKFSESFDNGMRHSLFVANVTVLTEEFDNADAKAHILTFMEDYVLDPEYDAGFNPDGGLIRELRYSVSQIVGAVYDDRNCDGLLGAGEGISGAVVSLDCGSSGTSISTTDASGVIVFSTSASSCNVTSVDGLDPGCVPVTPSQYPSGSFSLDSFPDLVFDCGNTCAGAGGDPHFKRFNHLKRSSFHGECDLVLLQSVEADVAVHIRTTLADTYSFIEQVAIKVGKSTFLEFHQDILYVNGSEVADDKALSTLELADDVDLQVVPSKRGRSFTVKLANGLSIIVLSAKQYMSVKLGGRLTSLKDSVGMWGSFPSGDLFGRDGRVMTDYQDYGHEWQVHSDTDGELFMEARSPQWPYDRCHMPAFGGSTSRRRLRANNGALHEQALTACTATHPDDVELCVDDVLMTGDLDILAAW